MSPPPPPPPPASGDYTTAAAETTANLQPWSDFFDFAALSLPVSLSDATARLNRNLTHFQLNYVVITTAILLLSLIVHPISLLLLAVSAAAWYFLYFARRSSGVPLEVFGFTVDDRVVFAILGLFTFVALILANVWFNLFVSIAISAVVVCLHGVLRVPSFGDDDPYGGLLDVTDGAYSEF